MQPPPNLSRRILLGVVIAHCPNNAAGNTWAFMNWALGLRSIGWDVWLVESMGSDELAYAEGAPREPGGSLNHAHWREVVAAFGFEGRATLLVDGESPDADRFRSFAEGAEVFVNLSGQFPLGGLLDPVPRKAYVDLDPVFSQIWAVVHGCDMNWAGHTHFFSVGTTLATAHVPPTEQTWLPVVPPVSLAAHWPVAPEPPASAPWTTVTYWYAFNELEWGGLTLKTKRESFLDLLDLPGRSAARMLVATDLAEEWGDYKPFRDAGWEVCKPETAGADTARYREFIAASRGEIGVAKHGYVVSRSGWLSDRSVCYLASGRPALLQDTGWTSWLEPRDGMLAFSDTEQAAAAIRAVESDYARHAAGARKAAEEIFDARRVLPDFLRRTGIDI